MRINLVRVSVQWGASGQAWALWATIHSYPLQDKAFHEKAGLQLDGIS